MPAPIAAATPAAPDNPMGTEGFEFIEYAAPDPKAMGAVFERMGFTAIARHRQPILPARASNDAVPSRRGGGEWR